MRIIAAPDKFKGSMTALEAARSIKRGVRKAVPDAEVLMFPLSDGGEGLVESLTGVNGGRKKKTRVTGPLGKPVEATWGIIEEGTTAVLEMASASGLALVPKQKRNPSQTTTYGTGELIKAALDEKCSKLIIGIGGSATNDGGAGMARALGVKFYDYRGKQLDNGGGELIKLKRIDISDLDSRLEKVSTLVACDVNNPLTGPQGASKVYGPQKGATSQMCEQLDRALQNYAARIEKDLGIKIDKIPGSGAAGGLGAGLITFLGAELRSGINLVLDALKIDQFLPKCRLLITGEGKLDAQTACGKAPVGVAVRARKYNVPVIALAGSLEGSMELLHRTGIISCFAIADGPLTLEESLSGGPLLLENKVSELMLFWNFIHTGI